MSSTGGIAVDDGGYLSGTADWIAYDSKYPQCGQRSVVTGTNWSLFTLRPTQKAGLGAPGDQFSCWYPAWVKPRC